MRTNATLEAAQKSGHLTPYVTVEYYTSGRPSDAGGSWTRIDNVGSKQRILDIRYDQEPYGSQASIVLDNSDGAFDAYNLNGKWVAIGWGAVCSTGNEVSHPPYLKCYAQDFISRPGQDMYVLHCEGAFSILRRWIAEDDLCFNQPGLDAGLDNKTGLDIIDYIAEQAGLDLGANIGTLDGKIDSWKPAFTVQFGENGMEAIRRLLQVFRCVLLPRTDCLHAKYCQAGDSVDYTYEIPVTTGHVFKDGYTRSLYFKPMKVKVINVSGNSGEYAHADWDSSMGVLTLYDAWGVTGSDADCEWLAQAQVERAELEADAGYYSVPIMNCLQELYDKVTITDNRGNTGGTGRVGGLYARYQPLKGVYRLDIGLGGLQRQTAYDIRQIVDEMALGGGVSARRVLKQQSIGPELLLESMRPYVVDMDWSSTGVTNATWSGGTVHFAEGTPTTLDAGSKDDLSATHFAYFIVGNSTVQWSTDFGDTLGRDRGLLAVAVKGNADSSKALILPAHGKEPVLSANILYSDLILGKHIKAGEVDTDHLKANSITGDKIQTDTIELNSLVGMGWQLLTNPDFETGDLSGWRSVANWVVTGDKAHSGSYSAKGDITLLDQCLRSHYFKAKEGDIFYAEVWSSASVAANSNLKARFTWLDENKSEISYDVFLDRSPSTAWAKASGSKKAPANTQWVELTIYTVGTGSPAGNWCVDDLVLLKGSQVIVQGTPGGARVEINSDDGIKGVDADGNIRFQVSPSTGQMTFSSAESGNTRTEIDSDGIRGKNASDEVQFELSSSTGKATCGGGRIEFNSDGVQVTDTQHSSSQLSSSTHTYSGNTNFSKGQYWILAVKMECTTGTFINPWLIGYFVDSNGNMIVKQFANRAHTSEMWLDFVVFTGPVTGGSTPYLNIHAGDESGETKVVTLYKTRLI